MALGGFAAGPVARVPRVARVALALECALLVYAHLGTRSGVGTLVDVCNKKKTYTFVKNFGCDKLDFLGYASAFSDKRPSNNFFIQKNRFNEISLHCNFIR